jgi:hypothetical protein
MFGKFFGKQGSEYDIKFILKRSQADKKNGIKWSQLVYTLQKEKKKSHCSNK